MNNLTITRKKTFRAILLPYFIVLSPVSKEKFMQEHHLDGDLCGIDMMRQSISRMDVNILESIGIAISNGETKEINLTDNDKYIFVSTIDGSLSNEININEIKTNNLLITTRGGLKTVCYPFIKEQ